MEVLYEELGQNVYQEKFMNKILKSGNYFREIYFYRYKC